MPNRVLKESICMSDSIDGLKPESEILFYRLIVQCDDYGRTDARPSVIRAKCYPLKIDKISDANISDWMTGLIDNNLVTIYKSGDKHYIQIPTWNKHQQIRAKRSKFPEPEEILNQLQSHDYYNWYMLANDFSNNHNHLLADDSNSPRNPIQSNPIRNPNPNPLSETKVSDEAVKLTQLLKTLMLENNPNVKVPENLNKWALEVDRMIRLDNRQVDEIEKVIRFSQKDNFWMTNILSCGNLREKYDQLYLKMKNNGNGHHPTAIEGNKPTGVFASYEKRDNN